MNKQEKIVDLKNRNFSWPIPWDAVELIAGYEDCALTAYLCPAGVPTIGWGETNEVDLSMRWTKEQADKKFFEEIYTFTENVRVLCTAHTRPEQLGAFVSLAYNIGLGNFKNTTVLKAHNEGRIDAAARAFTLWNKARVDGKLTELRGLTARRLAESALYMRNDNAPFPEPFAQAIAPESSMAKSHINISGAAAVVAGGTTLASNVLGEAMPILTQVKQAAEALSINPLIALSVLVTAIGAVVMYWRYKQRDEGWA